MKKQQGYFILLLTLTSFNVALVTIERFSFTTQILLAPYDFLRLHEVVQMVLLVLFTVLIPTLLLREVTDNFRLLQKKYGIALFILFISGVYLYATGNGVHELASFVFNTYCDTENITDNLCGGLFFNDYYFGNGVYFLGAFLMNLSLLMFEYFEPVLMLSKKQMKFLLVNALLYALALFAYATYDRVLIGLVYSIIMTAVISLFYIFGKKDRFGIPVTFYLLICYTLGSIASIIVRFV